MCRNAQKSLNAQSEIGRKLRGCDKSLGTIASELGWHRNTLDSYFPANRDKQPAKLPKGALWDILESGAFPAEIEALLLPDGFAMVRIPEGVDHYEVARGFREYLDMKAAAHEPNSEAGEAIGPNEDRDLTAKLKVREAS